MHRIPLGLALALALPGLAHAQPDPATPEPWREAWLAAHDACEGAYDSLTRTPAASDGHQLHELAELRARAGARLGRDGGPKQPFDPAEAREFLLDAREALLDRLRDLDPFRGAVEELAAEEAPLPPRRLRIYDVSDLARYDRDAPLAPELHLTPAWNGGGGGSGSGGVLCFDDEDYDTGSCLEPDLLIELLESTIGYDDDGELTAIEYSGTRLFVRATDRVQALVAAELAALRQRYVTTLELELRAYVLPTAAAAALRAAAHDGLDADESSALLGDLTPLTQQRITTRDGRRALLQALRLTSYQGDIEVNQTGVVPVLNPVIQQLRTGFVAEVRPRFDRDHGRVWFEVDASYATQQAEPATTTFAGYDLLLPRIALHRIHGQAEVPLDRAAVMGGTLAQGDGAQDLLLVIRARRAGGAQ